MLAKIARVAWRDAPQPVGQAAVNGLLNIRCGEITRGLRARISSSSMGCPATLRRAGRARPLWLGVGLAKGIQGIGRRDAVRLQSILLLELPKGGFGFRTKLTVRTELGQLKAEIDQVLLHLPYVVVSVGDAQAYASLQCLGFRGRIRLHGGTAV